MNNGVLHNRDLNKIFVEGWMISEVNEWFCNCGIEGGKCDNPPTSTPPPHGKIKNFLKMPLKKTLILNKIQQPNEEFYNTRITPLNNNI